MPLAQPHPSVQWPAYCYVWIGPDGRVIRKGKAEAALRQARTALHKFMAIKDINSVHKKEIGILGKGWQEFPLVIVDPQQPYTEARSPSQMPKEQ